MLKASNGILKVNLFKGKSSKAHGDVASCELEGLLYQVHASNLILFDPLPAASWLSVTQLHLEAQNIFLCSPDSILVLESVTAFPDSALHIDYCPNLLHVCVLLLARASGVYARYAWPPVCL